MNKTLDQKGRWRKKVVAFRVSEEESELIDNYVRLSGLTKQDYIIKRLQNKDIVVQGNPRVYKALRNQLTNIYEELKRIKVEKDVSDEMLYTLQLIAETLQGFRKEV